MSYNFYFKLVITLTITINSLSAERIKDMIYMSIDGAAACFRRHNGTHQFGCSSTRSGSVGVIQLVETFEDVNWIESNATAGPYTVILPFTMFTKNVVTRLDATNNINGILITKNSSQAFPSSYSPEDTCPNKYSGIQTCDDNKIWNPWGNGFLLKDWKFPIFYVENDDLLDKIKNCYFKHNAHNLDKQKERPLCALEMQSFMTAAVDSETCIRRSKKLYMNPMAFCDPLSGLNIHWPLSPLKNKTESMILVIARLDASSMFDNISPGANSAVTGLVTLLATAYYLNLLNATVEHTNVLFSLLNGESFDYIGSSRFVYDLKEGNFNALGGENLKLNKIKTVIELGQLGNDKLYLHANNYENNDVIINLQKILNLQNTTLSNSVPPASIQSFLAVNRNLTAVVLASHGEQFTNKYYGGILDNIETLGNEKKEINTTLTRVAMKLGDVLYEKITGKKSPSSNVTIIEELISEMLFCYLKSAKCNLFQAASPPGSKLPNHTYPLYVGVNSSPNHATSLTGQLLALLTGEKLPNMTANKCNQLRLAWMGGYNFTGICINSTVNYTTAISPAFTIEGYEMKSGKYSTWTESRWHILGVRMFIKPSATVEQLTITLGSVTAIMSLIIVWFINSRADILFGYSVTAEDC
ncbi:nicastrin [Microplitis demolitor]|uniref:nicastrin n=1 Tax=Microplitis demolitor TaxID=69319 RepID=UPI0004CCF598|nr:nicastrin [Microplitis demolitor]